jgi:hypothetical protein
MHRKDLKDFANLMNVSPCVRYQETPPSTY